MDDQCTSRGTNSDLSLRRRVVVAAFDAAQDFLRNRMIGFGELILRVRQNSVRRIHFAFFERLKAILRFFFNSVLFNSFDFFPKYNKMNLLGAFFRFTKARIFEI